MGSGSSASPRIEIVICERGYSQMEQAVTKLVEFLEHTRLFLLGSFATLLLLHLDGYEGLNSYIYWTMGLGVLTLITPELKRRSHAQKSAMP